MVSRELLWELGLILVCPQSSLATDLPSDGLVVDEASEVHSRGPRVILVEDTGTARLLLLPLGHSQLIPREALVRPLWSPLGPNHGDGN